MPDLKGLRVSCRAVIMAVARDQKWPIGWAFDGKNIFAPSQFLPQHPQVHQVGAASFPTILQHPYKGGTFYYSQQDLMS